jgi:hypothetical protein
MTKLRAFAAIWYDFIVGDDWVVAVQTAAAKVSLLRAVSPAA